MNWLSTANKYTDLEIMPVKSVQKTTSWF